MASTTENETGSSPEADISGVAPPPVPETGDSEVAAAGAGGAGAGPDSTPAENGAEDDVSGSGDSGDSSDSDDSDDMEEDLQEGDGDNVQKVAGICSWCHKTGMNRVLKRKIPFFKDIIIMSFSCPHCGFRDQFIESSEIGDEGVRYNLTVTSREDMNRQIVKSKWATIRFQELELEIPPMTQSDTFNTVEGLLQHMISGLSSDQLKRREVDPEGAAKVEEFLTRATMFAAGLSLPFHVLIDDLSGNSFIENPNAPANDPNLKVAYYKRTQAQAKSLGMMAANATEAGAGEDEEEEPLPGDELFIPSATFQGAKENYVFTTRNGQTGYYLDIATTVSERVAHETFSGSAAGLNARVPVSRPHGSQFNETEGIAVNKPRTEPATTDAEMDEDGEITAVTFDSSAEPTVAKELMAFRVNCCKCGEPGEERMVITDIPYFQEVILMSFTCDYCGFRSTEVKPGGEIGDKGKLLTLSCVPGETMIDDLRRDVIKADSAAVEIMELEFTQMEGTVGGMYTTVEGLLNYFRTRLVEANPFQATEGDSRDHETHVRFQGFMRTLDAMIAGETAFTLRIRDPLARSWIHSPYSPNPDPRLSAVEYTRTAEEDEGLGLTDMDAPDEDSDEEESKAGLPTIAEDEDDEDDSAAGTTATVPTRESLAPVGSVDQAAARAATARR